DYAAWNYFQSLDRVANRAFVEKFRSRYGRQRVVADPMEAGVLGVHLRAEAVEAAGGDDVLAIREALRHQRRPSLSPNAMPRDSRCRLARGYSSPQIPAAAQGAIQSKQIGGDRRLTLCELILGGIEFVLRIEHRQKVDLAGSVLFECEINCLLVLLHGLTQPIATLLLLRIVDKCVLPFLKRLEDGGLVADHSRSLS